MVFCSYQDISSRFFTLMFYQIIINKDLSNSFTLVTNSDLVMASKVNEFCLSPKHYRDREKYE